MGIWALWSFYQQRVFWCGCYVGERRGCLSYLLHPPHHHTYSANTGLLPLPSNHKGTFSPGAVLPLGSGVSEGAFRKLVEGLSNPAVPSRVLDIPVCECVCGGHLAT
jgi:hypothetical protein